VFRFEQGQLTSNNTEPGMRIAFVDLLFSWPPHGGGDVDVFHVAAGTQAMGHEVCLFAARDEDTWERGRVAGGSTPFPVEVLSFCGDGFSAYKMAAAFRAAVDAWRPDAVYIGQGFLMKPAVTLALSQYPIVSRFHAHEGACQRDMLRFLRGAPCPNCYLDRPDICRRCALDLLGTRIRSQRQDAWLREYVGAEAYRADYHKVFRDALRAVRVAVVYNAGMVGPLGGLPGEVRIIPSGVDAQAFVPAPPAEKRDGRKTILMAGRAEDPAKGFAVLAEAAWRLWEHRQDFDVLATLPQDMGEGPWLRPLGWVEHADMPGLYAEADICVVPSVWDEPWGIVALEAMASERPVCASRAGGLAEIVADGETGPLFERGDAGALAAALDRLLDDAELRQRMGIAGRARVLSEYDWDVVMEKHYRPLWNDLAQGAGTGGA
jgi:glycosyltransferase involved in cell wall biosynthesis